MLGRAPHCAISLDDASLSAEHLRLSVGESGDVTVVDAGSRNGTSVDGLVLRPREPRKLEPGEIVQAGQTLLSLEHAERRRPVDGGDGDGFVAFNRPPRVNRPLEQAVRPFPAPPDDPQRARLPIGVSLVPLALGVGLYVLTKMPAMLFFAALSPVMAVSTFIEDRRSGKKGFTRRAREYRERLAALGEELERERTRELRARWADAPAATELVRRVQTHDPRLWERRLADDDFLSLRVGTGAGQAHVRVRLESGGNDRFRAEAEELADWYATVAPVPALPLADAGAAGCAARRTASRRSRAGSSLRRRRCTRRASW